MTNIFNQYGMQNQVQNQLSMIFVSYNQKDRLKDNPGLLCHEEISSHKTKYLTNHIEMNSRENLTTYLIDS